MKKISLTFICGLWMIMLMLLPAEISGQKTDLDSLRNVVQNSSNKTGKAAALELLILNLVRTAPKESLNYSEQLEDLAVQWGNDSLHAAAILKKGTVQRVLSDYEAAEKTLLEAEKKLEIQKNQELLAECLYQKGALYCRMDKNDIAIKELDKGLRLADQLGKTPISAKILNVIGIIHKQNSNYEKAIEIYLKSLSIHEQNENINEMAISHNSLGVAFMKLERTEGAEENFKKSLEYALQCGNKSIESYQYRNLGQLALGKGEFNTAKELFEKSLVLNQEFGQPLAIGGIHADLADVNVELKKLEKAKFHAVEAMKIFKEIDSPSSMNYMRELQSRIYFKEGKFEKSRTELERYYEVKDSLESLELKETIAQLEEQYESEKNEATIATQKLTIEEEKRQNTYLWGGLGILFLGIGFLFYLNRLLKKKKNQEIQILKREQQVQALKYIIEGEERERNRISKELHDGVNGDLSALKFKLHSLSELNNKIIGEAIDMVDQSYEQVRAISHNLTPPSLVDFELEHVLKDYCTRLDKSTENVEIIFSRLGDQVKLNKDTEINLFRMVQELVTNALKYAECSQVMVQMSSHNSRIQITVEDDGKGFDIETQSQGLGLKNLKSRAVYLEAELDISSNSRGTSAIIELEIDGKN